jgi:hypothetical protein
VTVRFSGNPSFYLDFTSRRTPQLYNGYRDALFRVSHPLEFSIRELPDLRWRLFGREAR